jgi:hypothetical protein
MHLVRTAKISQSRDAGLVVGKALRAALTAHLRI